MNSAKLRARQKERLAKLNSIEECRPDDILLHLESFPQCLRNVKDGEQTTKSLESVRDKSLITDLEDNRLDPPWSKVNSPLRLGTLSKNKSSHLDLSSNPHHCSTSEAFLPSHRLQGRGHKDSVLTNNLPVLGLCAPNANQRYYGRLSRRGAGPDFPFSLAESSNFTKTVAKDLDINLNRFKISDALADVSWQHTESSIPDAYLPFRMVVSLSLLPSPLTLSLTMSYLSFFM